MSTAPTRNPELWQCAVPLLPTHDAVLTGGFLAALGFRLRTFDTDHLVAAYGGVELHYARNPDVEPFALVGSAHVWVTNAELLYAELFATDVMPDAAEVDDVAELRARWVTDRDVSRLGPLRENASGTPEFDLFDPTNNLLRCRQAPTGPATA